MFEQSSELQYIVDILRKAMKMKWVIILIQVLATGAALLSLMFVPKQYRSTTTIRAEREKVINPLTRGLAVTSVMEERLRTLKQEIMSRDYIEKVIKRLGIMPSSGDPIKYEEMIQRMMENIQITFGARKTDTFQIYYIGEDPAQVRDVTNLLAGIFIEESLAFKEDEAGSALDFLKEQLEVYRKKLEESEMALRIFEEEHVDELPSAKNSYLSRLDFLRSSLNEIRNSIRQANIRKDLLLDKVPGEAVAVENEVGTVMIPNPLRNILRDKESQLRQALLSYSENYPDVIRLRAEIEDLKSELSENPTVPAGSAVTPEGNSVQEALLMNQLQQLDLEISTLTRRESQLEEEIARYEKKVQGIPQLEQEMIRLRRDYEVNSSLYEMFLRRVEEARVSRELEVSKKGQIFRILQAANLPLIPFKPNRLKILAAGVAAGIALNLVLLYWMMQKNTSFRSANDVQEYLGIKVIGGIPRLVYRRERLMQTLSNVLFMIMCAAYAVFGVAFLYWEKVAGIIGLGGR